MKLNIFLTALGLMLTLLVFSPSEIYFRNSLQFGLTVWELLATGTGLSIVIAGMMFLFLTVSARILPGGFQTRTTAVLMSLGLAAFLQGTYLGWRFGALDGSEIDWSQPLGLKVIGICFWLLPIVLPQIIAGLRTEGFVRAVCLVLLLTQSALLGVKLASPEHVDSYKFYTADPTPLMQFSSGRNAIVIVMDEFQCDIFSEVLKREPKLEAALAGFTFFPNAVAPAGYTFPSVTTMLTGIYYDNSLSAARYIAEAYQSQSLPAQLHQNGVRSELYTVVAGMVLISPELADNAIVRSYAIRPYARIVKYGLLRSFPVWLKRQTLQLEGWLRNRLANAPDGSSNADASNGTNVQTQRAPRYSWDMRVFRDGLPTARAVDQAATFKFIHLEGTHVEIHLDENLNEVEAIYSRENVIRQATGVVRLIDTFVQRLVALGIYERSVIVVTGDHGSGRSADMWLAPSDSSQADFNRVKARGCPLLLAKPAGDGGGQKAAKLKVSLAPVAVTDIPLTILEELNIASGLETSVISGIPGGAAFSPAKSLFSIGEDEKRIRGYYFYDWEQFGASYLPPISEFIIEGNVWDDNSWRPGRTFVSQ